MSSSRAGIEYSTALTGVILICHCPDQEYCQARSPNPLGPAPTQSNPIQTPSGLGLTLNSQFKKEITPMGYPHYFSLPKSPNLEFVNSPVTPAVDFLHNKTKYFRLRQSDRSNTALIPL